MRHRFIFSLSVLVAAAFVVTSCAEHGTTEPTSRAVSTLADGGGPDLSAHAGNPVVFSARGSLHRTGPLAGGDPNDPTVQGLRTFSFTAQQRQDGSTTGHMQQNRHGGGQIQHGRVICMFEFGDEFVFIGAQGTQRIPETDPAPFLNLPPAERPDNHGLFFVVKDNGEGANAPADQFTGYISTTVDFLAGICVLKEEHPVSQFLLPRLPGFLNDVEAGNIQVTFP